MQVRLSELEPLAQRVIGRIGERRQGGGACVMFLSGELGAGKTTFMQALARGLGIRGAVQSPTFVLMRRYPMALGPYERLVHIDAYRLDDPKEFAALRPEEFLQDPHALVCIEWPEKITDILPEPDIILRFAHVPGDPGVREVDIA